MKRTIKVWMPDDAIYDTVSEIVDEMWEHNTNTKYCDFVRYKITIEKCEGEK